MFKSKRDAQKCYLVLSSCETIFQVNMAMNMIYNYGKLYKFNYSWAELDKTSHAVYASFVDAIDYEERLQSVKK